MKINGFWLAFGLLSLIDYYNNLNLEYNWVSLLTLMFVFLGFGMAFNNNKLKGKGFVGRINCLKPKKNQTHV